MLERRVVRKTDIYELTGLSMSAIDRLERPGTKYYDPTFPKRFTLGTGRSPNSPVGWWSDELLAWLEKRPRLQGAQPQSLKDNPRSYARR